jgi:sporulation protein YlmC with PRC-barrel domain
MDLIRDVLDNQIVDRHQRKMGKVDGIVVELRDNAPPRLAYIEIGMPTLARRIHPKLQQWTIALQTKWGAKLTKPYRIDWSKIRDVGIDVEVDVKAETTPALGYEQWLRDHLIGKIPGAN